MQAAGADDPLLQLESLPLYVHFDFKTQKDNNLLNQGLKDELFWRNITEINHISFKALKFLKIDVNIEEEEDLGQIF